jgi:DNA-directed RNA polymerase specialized sigma24 family protein
MGIAMDESLGQANLSTLADECAGQLQRRRRKEAADDRYCLEILRRALVQRVDQAWSMVQRCFSEVVRIWLRSHPGGDVALRRDAEENYIAQTFSRFWYATRNQQVEFATLNGALNYLHATLNGIITDTMRVHFRSVEVPLPDPGFPDEPAAEEHQDGRMLWESIQSLLPDESERRVVYLLYYCGLKPKEIARRFPQEFGDVKEIYRLNQNIIDRLRRSRDRLRWLLGGEEL